MGVTITVRDVPEDVRDALSRAAREHGQSLQAFVLAVLRRQASFDRNRQLLAEVAEELDRGGGAGADAPDAAALIERSRDRRDQLGERTHDGRAGNAA